jgi:hypothetical protein
MKHINLMLVPSFVMTGLVLNMHMYQYKRNWLTTKAFFYSILLT